MAKNKVLCMLPDGTICREKGYLLWIQGRGKSLNNTQDTLFFTNSAGLGGIQSCNIL